MEGNSLGLDFTFFHVDLVASKDNRDLLADTDEIACRDIRRITGADKGWVAYGAN